MSYCNIQRAPLSFNQRLFVHAVAQLKKMHPGRDAQIQPEESADARAERLARYSRHLLMAGEEEKARIAHELHDGLGSSLTAVNLDICWIQQRLADRPEIASRLARAREVLASTVEMKRRIMHELRPTTLDTLGLGVAIESHAAELSRSNAIRIETDVPDHSPPLKEGAPIALFRIFQEALNNAVRHAQATLIRISLREEDGCIALEVADNGVGIDPATLRGAAISIGLLDMQERATAIGGRLNIERGADGRGTVVKVSLPCTVAPA